jgi:hypothetical protein
VWSRTAQSYKVSRSSLKLICLNFVTILFVVCCCWSVWWFRVTPSMLTRVINAD